MSSPAEHRALELDRAKRLSGATACCALWGGVLTAIDDDVGHRLYIVSRWALTRSFNDLGEVERFLEQVGAAR